MFIKIKLEPQSLKVLSPLKNITYFSINDNATINDLKMKIEEYVDVPAERQEIRTLVEVFKNCSLVKEVCGVQGTAIMLYAYDQQHEFGESQFLCFLQIYTNELAAQQQDFEQRLKLSADNNKSKSSTSSTSSVTIIADSDTDRDSEETDTESSETTPSDLDSGSSSDVSNSSFCKKRKSERNYTLQNKKMDVSASSGMQYSDAICQYFDELPDSSKRIKTIEENTFSAGKEYSAIEKSLNNDFTTSCKTPAIEKSNENCSKLIQKENFKTCSATKLLKTSENGEKLGQKENDQTLLEKKLANADLPKIQSDKVTTTINKENKKNIHPCYSISPEIRDFLVIICRNDESTISNVEFEDLLVWFFDRFHVCDSASILQFDNKTAILLFDGKVYIACMNLYTFEWISANIIEHSLKSYKIFALKESKHVCTVVVPLASSTKNVLEIFDLLEKQNENLKTFKWSLQDRQLLLPDDKVFKEKAVSTFCTNEVFNISMDAESKIYLEKVHFKLKYCFWQLLFQFI